jgi:hypothetical protein
VTFAADIAPIVYSRCAGCHAADSAAPFPLLSYEDVRSRAGQIADVVERRIMPPWLPDPHVVEFAEQRVLSREEIGLIGQWAHEGAGEGNPDEAPPAPAAPDGWRLGEPDLVLEMPEEYTLRAEGADDFRNFVIPVPLDGMKYVRAVEVRPGNPRIVHHGVLLIDATPESRRLDRRDPLPGYGGMVYGSTAHSPEGHFIGWTPGKSPFVAPQGMAWVLEPGTDVVLQLHMLPTGKPETIRARIGLHFTDQPPERTPFTIRLGSLEIDIPAGDADYRIQDEFRLPVDVELLGVYPHAHYRGCEMRAHAELPGGESIALLHIPRWDFNWQDEYKYPRPIALPAGTTLTMEYSFDNSEDNPFNPAQPPRRVLWGPNSSDEMGDLWVQVLPGKAQDLKTLRQAFLHKEYAARLSGFAHAARVNPDDLAAHYNLGSLLEQSGKFADAEAHYRAALRIDPQHAQSLNNLGVVLCLRGDVTAAIPLFRQALESLPEYEEARENLDRALALHPPAE